MKSNLKTLVYFVSGAVMIAAPIALIKSSHYSPRFENSEKNKVQSWAGAEAYYHMLKADPTTGLINEVGRTMADQEAMLRMQNSSKFKTSSSALGLNWTELGPDNVGGRVRAIVFDKKNQNVIYAGGVSGGIFKSINGGTSWNPINDQLNNMIVGCMDQDASGNYIYFGTGEENSGGQGNSSFIGNGLYKMDLSTNAITSVTSTTTSYRDIKNVKCHKTDDNIIYLGTYSAGFKISKNAGATWGTAKLASTSAAVATAGFINDIKVGTDGSYVFCNSAAVYRSTTGDEFVTVITPSIAIIAGTNRFSSELAIAPSNPNYIYLAGVRGDSKLGGVCYTENGGLNWYKIANSSSTTFDPYISGGNGQGEYDNAITVHPTNPGLVYIGGAAYWKWNRSSAGIGTWNFAAYQFAYGSQQYVHSDIHAFEWDPFNSNKLIVGCDGGMFRSIDGGLNYTAINKGFNVTQPYAIAFERYPVLGLSSGFPMGGVACGNQDNGTTYIPGNYNGVKGSYPLGGGDGNFLDFSNIAPDAVFSSIYYGQVDRAANKSFNGGSEFVDVEYSKYNGGPGTPAFASFVTPIKLWENSADLTSLDSVWFTAPTVINNSAGTGDGFVKTLKSAVYRTDNSAIFDSLYLTIGTGVGTATAGINYTSPAAATLAGTVVTTFTTSVPFTLGGYSGVIIASRYGIAFGKNPEIDSIKVMFSTAPANGLVLKTLMTESFNSGADVKVSTETTSSTKFGYNLPTALAARGKIRVPDIMQARLAIGISGRVVVVKKPLNFAISPDWCTVASSVSRDESGANAGFVGTVQTMEWDPSGDNLYVGTQSGTLYRISHLKSLHDSIGVKSIDSLNANMIDSTAGLQRKRSLIRCTKIGTFSGGVITSISVDPINGSKIVVTVGGYASTPHVYYATSPATHTTALGIGAFTSKVGAGSTGLIIGDPIYSSLIELNNSNRVLVGTEHGLYATDDITVPTPIWSKENNLKLPNVPVFMIRQQTKNSGFCYNSGIIYVGTHGRGIWASDTYYQKSIVGINEIAAKDKTQVNGIKLYPNPTRDIVNLSFTITKSENLTLSIYDLKGVLVQNKVLGKLPEGEQLMQINADDLISGTYIVCLNSSTEIIGTNRLVIIK